MALTKQDLQEISQLLDPLQSDVQGMKQDMQDMRQDMQDMRQDMQDMKQDMQDMRQDVQDMSQRLTSLEVHIENETDRNIRLLAENHLDLVDKLNVAVDAHRKDLIFEVEISDLQTRVRRLEEKGA